MNPMKPKANVPFYVLITLNICYGDMIVAGGIPQTAHLCNGVNICVDTTSIKEAAKAYTKMIETVNGREETTGTFYITHGLSRYTQS